MTAAEEGAMQRVAVIGGGLIGASWAAWMRARGLEVRLHDPVPEVLAAAPGRMERFAADLARIAPAVPGGRLSLYATLEEALDGADYVQENAPENLALKRDLMARMDALLPLSVPIGSSTSALRPGEIQAGLAGAERILVAHPFNPPHLIPLVELVPGPETAAGVLDRIFAFFERHGKAPVRLRREATGHLANRMSAALWREAVHLVASGIASVADVDRAIRFGPGLRWAVDGPHMLYHLGGGPGGLAAYLEHLGPAQEARWADLGTPALDGPTRAALLAGMAEEADGRSLDELVQGRDARLIALLRAMEQVE